jgi:hypothetical protein
MSDQAPQRALTPADVAKTVADVKSFDPGLGSYSFTDLGAVVKFSDLMSKAGEMLPDHLRNKPALCMAVTMRATHWGFDPFALAMETYQAKQGGPIGYQAKVFTAALRSAGVKLKYRYEGEIKILDKPVTSARGNQIAARTATGDRKCIAYATIDGDVCEFETMTLDQITIKNSPLWHNDPDSQLAYTAGRGWARRYRADVIMGAYSSDEVEEMAPIKDVTPEPSGFAAKALAARKAAEAPEDAEEVAPDTDDQEPDAHWTEAVDLSEAFPGSESWAEGEAAHAAGTPRTDCPHADNEARAADWLAAWDAAAEAAA